MAWPRKLILARSLYTFFSNLQQAPTSKPDHGVGGLSTLHAQRSAVGGQAAVTSPPLGRKFTAVRLHAMRAAAPIRGLGNAFARLLAPGLRLTSLLLMVIWFTNALAYYGLVLLTTTVWPDCFFVSLETL